MEMISVPRDVDMTFYNTANWGCELEGTGATREKCARVIASHFGVNVTRPADRHYDKYIIATPNNGTWTVMRDASVTPQKKVNGRICSADDTYRVEIVTPVMHGAKDIEVFQEVVRQLRKEAGFFPCSTAGCHIHIEIKNLPPTAIINIFNELYSKQKLLLKALKLDIHSARYSYCQMIPLELVEELHKLRRRKRNNVTFSDIADVYYPIMGDGDCDRHVRYPRARYYICNATRGLVINSLYYLGTIEFRMFNAENHAGKLKSYIQFCLLLCQYCSQISKSSYKEMIVDDDESTKYKFRCFLLKLNCIGDEFKTMRHFLLEQFGNQDSAWRCSTN